MFSLSSLAKDNEGFLHCLSAVGFHLLVSLSQQLLQKILHYGFPDFPCLLLCISVMDKQPVINCNNITCVPLCGPYNRNGCSILQSFGIIGALNHETKGRLFSFANPQTF